ncbi:MAG: RNA ligase [Proteobacteria bacterium]|nr:RNA ligase [Pseudomonadota bacterium]
MCKRHRKRARRCSTGSTGSRSCASPIAWGGDAAGDGSGRRRLILTYPHIGRFFVLAEGIRANFTGAFSVEEKVDGYNVRIFRHRGRLLTLGRGGWICPFTMDRLPDLGELDPVFDAHPDLILCCEVAGPNPYLRADPPRARDQLRLFVFDVMKVGGTSLEPVTVRDAILDQFDLPRVPVLGIYTPADVDAVADHVRALDAEGGEGIVMKSLTDRVRGKYVTPSINLRDMEADAELIPELPGEFFESRLVRIALGIDGHADRGGRAAPRSRPRARPARCPA